MDGSPKDYLNIREFSQFSGLSISTLRRRVREGSIVALQPGGPGKMILFPRDALERASASSRCIQSIQPVSTRRLPGRQPNWTVASKPSEIPR